MGAGDLIALASVLGAVALIAGLAFLFLRLVAKVPGSPAAGGTPIRVLRSVAVGQRERVTLVTYRGEVFMLGVSAGGVSLLARMEEAPELEVAAPATPWLADQFKLAMRRAQKAEREETASSSGSGGL
ncbi:FliO/MopB family protein [Parvularcula dongshanensis]|uniref:Flagellar biogenesis protein FliO n=1 Tax=Parvularcula dongshanensis TaxID=1173995 RepID=A0A840I0A7_9PROT|nr:flagellar biosynthetic protein FliO [Parvularcula dongshanensis]MBB4657608.1 flagellar biogenesis protein FliO [Parvularcula dongshanensis]